MRYALAAAAFVCLAGLGLNQIHAGAYYCDGRYLPNHTMNYHCPYYIPQCAYWGPPCGYGIRGPSDLPGQPVNGMPAPCYCPRPFGDAGQAPVWHRYMRSPRDFFMLQY
jgi:hypothetical protein